MTVVCEASSFQLEDAEAFAPECAVLLNVTPDHLDRHHDFEDYLQAKLRIFANQGNDDVAVFNADEPALEGRDLGGCARRIAYCRGADPDCAVSINEDVLFVGSEPLMEVAELSLPGPHNADNAMAAAVAATAMGIDRGSIREALRTFPGVPHRLERVAEIDGVLYVNDSKATNVAAAVAALRSFDGGVRAILGGSLKGGGFEGLAEPVAERCVACYLIGEAADALASDLAGSGVELRRSGDLETAVREAARDAIRERGGAARPGVRELRRLPRLRGAGRALPRPGRGARAVSAFSLGRLGPRTRTKSGAQPIEYSLLLTATLCLLAFGVVMVFSASSTTALLGQSGDSAYYLKRTLAVGAIGLVLMRLMSVRGAKVMRPLTGLLLIVSFGLLVAVMLPGIGSSANGAQRWIGAGPLQIQPSELAKLALVLYGANLLATRPQMTREIRTLVPYLAVVGMGCLLMMAEPDLGTAIVVSLSTAALLVGVGGEDPAPPAPGRRPRSDRSAPDPDRAVPDAAPDRVPQSHGRPERRRVPGDPGEDRDGLRRLLRRRPRPEPAEGLLSP